MPTPKRRAAEKISSEGFAERPIPLLASQDISQMKDHEIIGFHRHLHPFRLNRCDWRKQALLYQRRKMLPPQLQTLPQLADIQVETAPRVIPSGYVDPDMIDV